MAVPFVNYAPRAQPILPANPINDVGAPLPGSTQFGPPQPAGGDAMGAIIRSLGGQGVLPPNFQGGPVTQGPGPLTAPAGPAVTQPPPLNGGAPSAPWVQGTKQGGILNPFTGIQWHHLSPVSGVGHARPAHPSVAPPTSFAQWFTAHRTAAQGPQHPLVQLLQGLFGQQAPTV